ncbi:MAG: hypothetical protein ACJAZN_000589 [Planctomycetota bacterium]|jgi:hypothetical protein
MTLNHLSAALLAAALATSSPAPGSVIASVPASPALPSPIQTSVAPEVDVSLSSSLVKVGEPVVIRVNVSRGAGSGGRGGGVKFGLMPEVEGVEFGRWQSAGTSTIMTTDSRGRTVASSKSSYLIEVKPAGAGEYVIPPISMTIDGDVYVRPIEGMELRIVEDLAASDLLFMERQDVPKRVFEGEPYTVEIDWGWDAELEHEGLNLRLPWYGRQDGVVELEMMQSGDVYDFPAGRNQATKVMGIADVKRDGRRFRAFRFRRRFVATRPGKVEFSRSIFEFAPRAERGSRFIRGRTRSYYRPLAPFSIEVVPVPEAGRPIAWTGAVGMISASREALNRDVDAGEPIDFTIIYEGEGNLEFFSAPDLSRLPAFDGFRVLGVDDEKGAYERVIKYDLVPLNSSITEVPSVPLIVFDTGSETYVELRTESLPIRVRAVEGAGDDPFGGEAEVEAPPAMVLRDIEARPVGTVGGAAAGGFWSRGPGVGGALLALVLSLVGWILMRKLARAQGDPNSAEARRRRKALRSLERGLSSTDPIQRSAAFEAFLAARTATEPGEWIGQAELPLGQVNKNGLSKELQETYARLRRHLDAAVFGGHPAAAPSADEVRAFARLAVKEGLS